MKRAVLVGAFACGVVALLLGPFLMTLRREAIVSQKVNEITLLSEQPYIGNMGLAAPSDI